MATDSVTAFLSKVLQAKRNRKNTSCRCPEMCVDPGDLGSTDAHGRPLEDYGLLPVELRHLGNLWL
ncbi:MAG: hypothetical protein LR017_00730 [Candidatus Pacebacteria bacterium]|nr:hypothetical protein [Candidatus Paceibacterota bacterium]